MELSENAPIIQLKEAEGFVHSDTSISAGKQFTVGIIATSANGENLTNLIVEINGDRFLDKGFNIPEIDENILITKSLDSIEIINFIIRNKSRKADTISITITKQDSSFSEITRYSSIILGAQNNTGYGGFFSFSNGMLYTQSQAFINQSLIDIVYYYDAIGDANTIASPGANLIGLFVGADAPEFWPIKRTTFYTRASININDLEFNSATNDSLIVSNLFTGGGRKAKQLQNAQYYAFQSNENKFGIIKIENVTGQTDGTIQFSLIIQQ